MLITQIYVTTLNEKKELYTVTAINECLMKMFSANLLHQQIRHTLPVNNVHCCNKSLDLLDISNPSKSAAFFFFFFYVHIATSGLHNR